MENDKINDIFITGANGKLGALLFKHFAGNGAYKLRGLDIQAPQNDSVIRADLSNYDTQWVEYIPSGSTIIHLAASGKPEASWELVTRHNIDATLNLFNAAVERKARRVIFASSTWVAAGLRDCDIKLHEDLPPSPVNAYGASKLAGERIAKSASQRHGLSSLCLRIGWVLANPSEQVRVIGQVDNWTRQLFLSDRDFCAALEGAIHAPKIDFEIFYILSANPQMRWDINKAQRILNYTPQDGVQE